MGSGLTFLMPARVTFSRVVPILRIFDVGKTRKFYVDYMGFTVDWEHRFSDDAPLYMQVSRGGWCCTCPSTTATERPPPPSISTSSER